MDPSLEKLLNDIKEKVHYCYSCNACDTVCPTNLIRKFSPRVFMRKLAEGGLENLDEILKDANLFNCLTCAQCMSYCPMNSAEQGVQFTELMKQLRAYAYQKGLISKQLNDKATHDNIMQLLPRLQADSGNWVNKIDFLMENQSLKIAKTGDIAYFVGCAGTMQGVFYSRNIKYTDTTISTIKLLNLAGITPVVLENKCCGHDSLWIGDVATAKKLAEFNIKQYKDAGVKTIICVCAEGLQMWKYEYPKLVSGCDFEVKHISEFLLEKKIVDRLSFRDTSKVTITFHDPCRLGRMSNIYDAPRQVLEKIPGVKLVEMENSRENAQCCGVSAFMECDSGAHLLRELRIKEALATGANYLLTSCPKCITHFNCYLDEITRIQEEDPSKQYPAIKLKIIDFIVFVERRTR